MHFKLKQQAMTMSSYRRGERTRMTQDTKHHYKFN